MSTGKEGVERIAITSSIWDMKVEPSTEGSGALPPNPTFSEDFQVPPPSPELDRLIESFSTPVDYDFLLRWFP